MSDILIQSRVPLWNEASEGRSIDPFIIFASNWNDKIVIIYYSSKIQWGGAGYREWEEEG